MKKNILNNSIKKEYKEKYFIYKFDQNNKGEIALAILMMSIGIIVAIFIAIAMIYIATFSLGFLIAESIILLVIGSFMKTKSFILKKIKQI